MNVARLSTHHRVLTVTPSKYIMRDVQGTRLSVYAASNEIIEVQQRRSW